MGVRYEINNIFITPNNNPLPTYYNHKPFKVFLIRKNIVYTYIYKYNKSLTNIDNIYDSFIREILDNLLFFRG